MASDSTCILKFLLRYIRYIVYACNLLFLVLGFILFGIGMWVKLSVRSMDSLIQDKVISNSAIIMITCGAFIIVLSLFGFYATRKKMRKLLHAFLICVLIVLLLEVGGGAYAFAKRKDVRLQLSKGIDDVVRDDYGGLTPTDKQRTDSLDWIHENVECCGSDEPNDWSISKWYTKRVPDKKVLVPPSCCIDYTKGCNEGDNINSLIENKMIFPYGCKGKSDTYIKRRYLTVGRIGIVVACVQLFGMLFVYCLHCLLTKSKKNRKQSTQTKLVPTSPPPENPAYPY